MMSYANHQYGCDFSISGKPGQSGQNAYLITQNFDKQFLNYGNEQGWKMF